MDKIIGESNVDETKVFFHKMKGDYHRYLSEVYSNDGESLFHFCLHSGTSLLHKMDIPTMKCSKAEFSTILICLKTEKIKTDAEEAYKAASDTATKELNTCHPIRLGLALNFSVFYYEIMKNPSKAIEMAKKVSVCDVVQASYV